MVFQIAPASARALVILPIGLIPDAQWGKGPLVCDRSDAGRVYPHASGLFRDAQPTRSGSSPQCGSSRGAGVIRT